MSMSHNGPSSSVQALAAVVTILSVLVLGTAAWRIKLSKRRRQAAPSSSLTNPEKEKKRLFHKDSLSKFSLKDLELSKRHSIHPIALPPSPPSPDSDDGWFPKLTPWRPPSTVVSDTLNIAAPIRPNRPRSLRLPFLGDTFLRTPVPDVERAITPPPTYYIANGGVSTPASSTVPQIKISAPTSPPVAAIASASYMSTQDQVPATRIPSLATRAAAPPPLKLTITPPPIPSPDGTPVSAATIPSPRRVDSLPNSPARSPASVPGLSIAVKTPKSGSSFGSRHNRPPSPKRLPRLVKVVIQFTPLEHDELACNVGDTLRLLEEYEDEWCLVQRVGREDAEKGVVPRFCVQDRHDVVPSYWGPYFASQGSAR